MSIFCDVTSGAYKVYIDALFNANITAGCGPGTISCDLPGGNRTFCPTDNIQNYMSLAFIVKALTKGDPPVSTVEADGQEDKSGVELFSDMTNSDTGFGYVQKAAKLGILCGDDREYATPDFTKTLINDTSNTTRGQMACWIVRALGNTSQPSSSHFTDVLSTDKYWREINILYELGVTAGCTSTTFCPTNNIARQEMAVFIVKAFRIPTQVPPEVL